VRRVWRLLVSLRTTAALLVALTALLVVNALVPQASFDPQGHALAVRGSRAARFALETLRLGSVSTSPLFVGCVAAFFVNLAAVLVDRAGATWRRVRVRPPTPAQLDALLAAGPVAEVAGAGPSAGRAGEVLADLGYRTLAVPGGVWGVKNRLALLGFPLFHASFFLLLAGGLQLYLTRDVRTLVVTEGQEATSDRGAVVRRAPLGDAPAVRIGLVRVDPRLEAGRPISIAAALVVDGPGPEETARVNHPVERGPVSVLVERAGLAPVVWLTDRDGYTLDRVLVPVASRGPPTRVPLATGDLEVALEPVPLGPRFPEREALPAAPVTLTVRARGGPPVDATVRPGEPVVLGERVLRIEELRYWAELRIVRERGGALLVAGFLLAVAGMAWRMLLFRREVFVCLGAGPARVAGRGEFFPARIADEVRAVAALLGEPPRAAEQGRAG
jgi:hypothetical protein